MNYAHVAYKSKITSSLLGVLYIFLLVITLPSYAQGTLETFDYVAKKTNKSAEQAKTANYKPFIRMADDQLLEAAFIVVIKKQGRLWVNFSTCSSCPVTEQKLDQRTYLAMQIVEKKYNGIRATRTAKVTDFKLDQPFKIEGMVYNPNVDYVRRLNGSLFLGRGN